MDLSYMVLHENHSSCYYFTNTSELKSALSTFPFDTNLWYVITDMYIFYNSNQLILKRIVLPKIMNYVLL